VFFTNPSPGKHWKKWDLDIPHRSVTVGTTEKVGKRIMNGKKEEKLVH
jgi:hypothetical protein